jgi:squalene-hopene/tetraprenyl-beta-curcumene cyclase
MIGEDMSQPYIRRAVNWLRCCQNPDGGWGESCQSYHDPRFKAAGPSTASQTAWALMGLMSAGDTDSLAVRAGIEYLLRTQEEDGNWSESYYTGTGFPCVFYLKYHLYRLYFPLMALGRFERLRAGGTHS